MKSWRAVVIASLSLALVACSSVPPTTQIAGTTFILVRHAEKGTDDPRDPSLSQAGMARAQRLSTLLASEPLVAVYATAYRRTSQTAQPVAASHSLGVITYDAKLPAQQFVSELRATHKTGTVLVVGHSNTVPEIAAALSGTVTAAMREDEFDRLYRVTIDADGKARLTLEKY